MAHETIPLSKISVFVFASEYQVGKKNIVLKAQE